MKERSGTSRQSIADSRVAGLITNLERVRSAVLEQEGLVDFAAFGDHAQSARNLLQYLTLRRFDLRSMQEELTELGISSLGRSESHVLYNLDAVLRILYSLSGKRAPEAESNGVMPSEGRKILQENATRLLGPNRNDRSVRIMVTMPLQAANDYLLVRNLVASGMDCMRINCAHDEEADWSKMISNLRRAERELGRSCKVLMDIAGPKIRTGRLRAGPQVLRVRPKKDAYGRVVKPALVWLTPEEKQEQPPSLPDAEIPLPREFLAHLRPGEKLRMKDARGSKRTLCVEARVGASLWASCDKTTYVMKGGKLTSSTRESRIGNIPHLSQPIVLRVGDILVVSAAQTPGRNAISDANGHVSKPAVVSCTLSHALVFVKKGDPIWFDDGKIGAVVVSASSKQLKVRITHAVEGGARLDEDKGINLPKTELRLPSITEKDLRDLKFIAKNSDMVGYSFVRKAEDVELLRSKLAGVRSEEMGIVLKIETLQAFEELPSILIAALRAKVVGVMIARGDLAVECGYERLAEVQEEILWLCEAAHMPAIWATQVLEGLTKNGIPSRAEVTDAAMGERAECVMLNKGPHMVEAVRALDNIMERMQAHQSKKRALLRQLNIAESFFKGSPHRGTSPTGPSRA